MAQYKYTAQTTEGKKVKGTMNAADELELHKKLRDGDMMLISAKESVSKKRRKPFKPNVLSDFSRQVSTLLASGVTLVRSLSIISRGEAVKPKEREVYEDMLARIRKGSSLSEAMEDQNGAFPPLMIYMLRSAESSGNIDEVAMKMAELYEKDHRLNSKMSSAMVYPKILSVMIVVVLLIMTQYVMPQFESIFGEVSNLPLTTRLLIGFSDMMEKYWYIVLIGAVAVYIGIRGLLTIPAVRRQWHKLILKVPVFGPLQKTICTSRFARTLSSLYAAGIPVIQAIQIARKTTGNDYIDQQFDEVIPFIRTGNNLSDGVDMIDGFVRKLADAIRVGEETGSLDSMLVSTSDAMEYDADMAINKMVTYIEPVMMCVMGVVVAVVVSGVFGAVYGSYGSIGGL